MRTIFFAKICITSLLLSPLELRLDFLLIFSHQTLIAERLFITYTKRGGDGEIEREVAKKGKDYFVLPLIMH